MTEKNKESFRENNKLFFRGIGAEDRFIDFFKSDDEFLEKSKIKCEKKYIKVIMNGRYGDAAYMILLN